MTIAFYELHNHPLYELVPCEETDLKPVRRCFWHYKYLKPDGLNVVEWVRDLYESVKYDLVKIQTIKDKDAQWYGHFDLLGDTIGLHAYKPVDKRLNIDVWLRIGAMALDYGFSILGARKIMTSVPNVMNDYKRMVEAIGFIPEGYLREAQMIKGKPVDSVLYSVLKYEFYGEEVTNDSKKKDKD